MEFDVNGIDCVFAEDILLKVFSAEDFTIKKLKAKWSEISSLYRNSHMSQKKDIFFEFRLTFRYLFCSFPHYLYMF